VLARLKELHRAEEAPPDFRVLVTERLARPDAPAPRSVLSRRGGIGLLLLAAATAAVALGVRSDRTRVSLLPEQPAASRTAELVSLSGTAVPGSLRWRGSGAAQGSERLECQYLFSLEPEGGAPIRVRWTHCDFPSELREGTQRPRSALSGPLRVFVAGAWSAPGQLEATEIRVLSRASEP
jgi:hypothetical protein